MNNEPVAWMIEKNGKQFFTEQSPINGFHGYDKIVPLYTHPVKQTYRELHEGFSTVIEATHPVKEQDFYGDGNVYRGVRSKDSEVQTIYFNPVKEITEWEIDDVWDEFTNDDGEFFTNITYRDFAKAILRKAQEK